MLVFYLIAALIVTIPVVLIGSLLDWVKNWKVIIIFQVLLLLFIVMFVALVPDEDHKYTRNHHMSLYTAVGFVGMIAMSAFLYTAN